MASIRTTLVDTSSAAEPAMNFPASGGDTLDDVGVQDGDLLVVYLADDGAAGTVFTPSEEGWTDHGSPASGASSMSSRLFSRVLGASESLLAYSFTRDNTAQHCTAMMQVVQPGEGETLSVADVDVPNAADGTQHSVEVTGVAGASVLLAFFANDSLFTVVTPPAGMTQDATQEAFVTSHALYGYSQVDPGTGTLTKTIEWSATEEMHSAAVLVQATTDSAFIAAWALGSNVVIK